MSDETVKTGQEEQATTEPQQAAAPQKPETIGDMVKRNAEAIEARDKSEAEAKEAEAEVNKDPEMQEHKKKPASQVIRELKKERNEVRESLATEQKARAEIETKFSSLETEFADIKARLASGEITRAEAKAETVDAQSAFQKAIESLKLSDDIEPYKGDIVEAARIVAKQVIDAELAPIRAREAEMTAKDQERQAKERENAYVASYESMAKDFPELYETGKDGKIDLKPEYQDKALEIFSSYNVVKNGKVIGNVLLDNRKPEDALKMILSTIALPVRSTEIKKKELEAEKEVLAKLKRQQVEAPESHLTTNKPKTLEDVVANAMRKHGLEVR